MVKIASSVPGVYLVGPSEGKVRPWCGKCHKFLKSETADHDCTPVNLSAYRGKSSKPRRFRMTKKKQAIILDLVKHAALEKGTHKCILSLSSAKSDKALLKAAKKLKKVISTNGFDTIADKMYHRIFK